MALAVTSNTTSVLTMNSTTDGGGTWTANGGGNPAADTDIFVETASINSKISATRGGYQVTTSTSYDFDDAGARKGMVAFWASTQSNLSDTATTGGICIRIGSSSSAYGEWQVATKTGAGGVLAYPGGFQRFVVDLSTTPNTTAGSPNYAAVNYWSILFDITNTVSGNIKNCWIDRLDILTAANIAAGTAACTASGTQDTPGAMFSEITSSATNTPQAFISRVGGVYGLNQPIQIGTTTGTNTFTSTNETCVWQAHKVANGFFFLKFIGGDGADTVTWGSKTGSGNTAVGTSGTTILTASPKWLFTAAETDIDTFQLYGCTLKGLTNCELGSTSTALGTTGDTYETVSNIVSDLSGQLVLNIGADTRNENSNQVIGAADADGSVNIYDSTTIDTTDWKVIDGAGFESTATAATRTITTHTFLNDAGSKPYISVQDSASAIWNMNNANDGAGTRPSVTDQTELAFAGTANGDINENYTVTWKVEQPDGTDINLAQVKILETAPSVALANQDSTNTTGDATSTYLRALYEPNGASALTTTTHTPAAFKTYIYGKLPSVSSATINQPVTNNVAMVPDTFQAEITEGTAVSDGTAKAVIVESAALNQSHSIIKVTGITGFAFAAGDSVSGDTSGASGTIEEIIEGSGSVGNNATIIVKSRNSTSFSGTENISDTTSGGDATLVSSSEKRFYWLVQAGTISSVARTIQQLYDHFQAKLAESPIDTADNWDDVIFDGRAEYGTAIEGVALGSPNSFKTIRNAALTHGWVISGLNSLLGVNSYTVNDGTSFTPQSLVTVTVTIKDPSGAVVPGTEVAIFQDNTARTVVLASTSTNASGEVTTTVTSSLGAIIIRARQSTNIATFDTDTGVNFTTEVITTGAAHKFQNGDAIVYRKNGGTLNVGLTDLSTYYVHYISDTTLSLHTTVANAIADTSRVNLLDVASSETHQLDPIRFIAGSATGTIGATDFSTTVTMNTDIIATG